MINLLTETLEVLACNGKTPADVRWVHCLDVGYGEQAGSWEDFAKIADIEYENGYGGNEVASSLIIAGDNWWLERGEYDGSEWWNFKTMPIKPETVCAPLTNVMDE
jgi:hypothetical protein